MRVLALVPAIYNTSPSQRYRLEQWEPLLRERGVEITYAPFEDEELHSLVYKPGNLLKKMGLVSRGFARRLSHVNKARNYDLVYIMREAALLGPPVFERLLHQQRTPVVFDFDDAIFVSYRSPSNGYLSYLKFASKTKTICRLSSHVMVGNAYLADYARQVNDNVTVIPTTIDTDRYQLPAREPRNESQNGPLVIGWTGSHSTVQHLDTLREALRELAKTEKFQLRVIGTPTYECPPLDVEVRMWHAETEVTDLDGIDIGVMPLPEDKWSKGKCGLKALQFMALGIPTICSPVGVNSQIIQDGVNGFLAKSKAEWIEKLTCLLRSPELRHRLGEAGRATVLENYSARTQAPRVYEVFKSVVRDAKVRTEAGLRSRPATTENHG
jgi:glycosyltransferase involved in cell wall biosynthesis